MRPHVPPAAGANPKMWLGATPVGTPLGPDETRLVGGQRLVRVPEGRLSGQVPDPGDGAVDCLVVTEDRAPIDDDPAEALVHLEMRVPSVAEPPPPVAECHGVDCTGGTVGDRDGHDERAGSAGSPARDPVMALETQDTSVSCDHIDLCYVRHLDRMTACQLTVRSRSPTTPAGSTPAATGWPRWWAACSGTWRSATRASRASAELADALLASRSAIAGAVNTLENLGLIRRSRAAGERMDRVRIDMSSPRAMGFDLSEYQEQGRAGPGGSAPAGRRPHPSGERSCWSGRRSPISWSSGFPSWSRSGRTRREALRAAGELPDDRPIHGESGQAMTGPTGAPGDRGHGRVQVVRRAIWCSTR